MNMRARVDLDANYTRSVWDESAAGVHAGLGERIPRLPGITDACDPKDFSPPNASIPTNDGGGS